METVGEILKKSRLAKKVSLEEVEEITRIRKKFLMALESDNLDILPPFTFSLGFLKNYCQYLDLPQERLVAIFKRQKAQKEKAELIPKELDESKVALTPKTATIVGIVLLVFLFSLYLKSQLNFLLGRPKLTLINPAKSVTVIKDSIIIKGKTDPEAKIYINGQESLVLENGDFSETINLNKGDNKIMVKAQNRKNKTSQKEIIIRYKPNE